MKVTLDELLDLRSLPGPERLRQLLSPFSGTINGVPFTIQKGFVTDLASIPPLSSGILRLPNNDPRIERAAVVHDWFYQYTGEPPYSDWRVTRAEADAILRDAMAVCGASFPIRWTVWGFVRSIGALYWHPHAAALRRTELHRAAKQARAFA